MKSEVICFHLTIDESIEVLENVGLGGEAEIEASFGNVKVKL